MSRVIFLLGGNQGHRFEIMFKAIRKMSFELGEPFASSGFYLTEPWGKKNQPWFLNCCIGFTCDLDPATVLDKTRRIEQQLGRIREEKWGPRTMDIDMLYFGDLIITTEDLIVPHPAIPERRFVLEPLMEVYPDHPDPVSGKLVREMLAECPETEKVIRL